LLAISVSVAALVAAAPAGESARAPVADGVAEVAALLGADAAALATPAARARAGSRAIAGVFQADAAIAALDDERARLQELLSWGQAARDRHVTTLNVGVGLFATGAAVGSTMQLWDSTDRAGTIVGAAAGLLGAAASLLATRAPDRSRAPSSVGPGLLGPYLATPAGAGAGVGARYPPLVWRYLDQPPPDAPHSRADGLRAEWRRLGRLPAGDSRADRRRRSQLVDPIPPGAAASLEAMSDRALMLADVRAQVSALKATLAALFERLRDGAEAP
jgi:hypothetical protein